MNTNKLKKTIIKALPYVLMGLVCTNLGEAWRLAEGADASKKLLSFFSTLGPAFLNPLTQLTLLRLRKSLRPLRRSLAPSIFWSTMLVSPRTV